MVTIRSRWRMLGVVASVAALGVAGLLHAGPLDPPVGPIAPTAKPLSEVEPRITINATNTPGDSDSIFKITKPGSYYLTGNITGVAGKHGIEIAASGVTLDLNGFDMLGVAGMGAFDGVTVTGADVTSVAVLNGSVRNWGDEGLDLGLVTAGCRVERVRASGNAGSGIIVGSGSIVAGCLAHQNTGFGISVTFNGCTITDSTAYQNGDDGFNTSNGCTISNCTSHTNLGDGFQTTNGCTLLNCTAHTNTGDGFSVQSGSTLSGCSARNNTDDAIQCSSNCLIRGNTCSNNGLGSIGVGIHVIGTDNRIESNHCTGAIRGIDVDSPGNIIVRNTCSGNTTDWVIVANNVVGPILDRRAPGSAAIDGFSAPDSTGSAHPNANFSY